MPGQRCAKWSLVETSGFAILGANILHTGGEPVWSRSVDHRFVQEPSSERCLMQ